MVSASLGIVILSGGVYVLLTYVLFGAWPLIYLPFLVFLVLAIGLGIALTWSVGLQHAGALAVGTGLGMAGFYAYIAVLAMLGIFP